MYCCMLLDRKGQAIQANIDLKDDQKYNELQLNLAYQIQRFGCQKTEKWMQTLDTKYTLLFGKFTTLSPIPADNFPEHYFRFAAYNEVARRLDTKQTLLTDYIGYIGNIDKERTCGGVTTNIVKRRNIDLQNLNGNCITVTLWNELAVDFKRNICAPLQQPVVMAISSGYIKRYAGGIQLSSTPATHVYLNPNIPETQQIHDVYNELLGSMGPLQIQQQINENLEGTQTQDRMSIQQMLEVNPETNKKMRFTVDATIVRIDNTERWFYNKCNVCGKHMDEQSPHWQCHESGTQEVPNHGYCFKAILQDETGSIPAKCFSPDADKWSENCLQVLEKTPEKDPYTIPDALRKLENTRKLFGIHFGTGSKKRRPKFVIHSAEDIAPLLLTGPPLTPADAESSSSVPRSQPQLDSHDVISGIYTPPPESNETPTKEDTNTGTNLLNTRRELFQETTSEQFTRNQKKPKKE